MKAHPLSARCSAGLPIRNAFLARFRLGELVEGSPMPWGAHGRMSEADLRSVYQYLRSLPPVEHSTSPTIQNKG